MKVSWEFLRIGQQAPMACALLSTMTLMVGCVLHQTSISADGRTVAYAYKDNLWVGEPNHLTHLRGVKLECTSVSPDGSKVAIARGAGGELLSVKDGTWTPLPDMWGPYAWSADGSSLTGVMTEGRDPGSEACRLRTYDFASKRVTWELPIDKYPLWIVTGPGNLVLWGNGEQLWCCQGAIAHLMHTVNKNQWVPECDISPDGLTVSWIEGSSSNRAFLYTFDVATVATHKKMLPTVPAVIGKTSVPIAFFAGEIRSQAARYGLLAASDLNQHHKYFLVFTDLSFHLKKVIDATDEIGHLGSDKHQADVAWSADARTVVLTNDSKVRLVHIP